MHRLGWLTLCVCVQKACRNTPFSALTPTHNKKTHPQNNKTPPPDFFTTIIHARFAAIIIAMVSIYAATFLLWALLYWATWRWDRECLVGFRDDAAFQSAVLFSIETMFTIGCVWVCVSAWMALRSTMQFTRFNLPKIQTLSHTHLNPPTTATTPATARTRSATAGCRRCSSARTA
jgi:hypothetical protein